MALDASNWKHYNPDVAEVFTDCNTKMNHAVLAIGYDLNDGYYWIKNSWGSDWGI